MELVKKRRENPSTAELEMMNRNIRLKSEPWDATLVPEEPNPNDYNTYEGIHSNHA